MNNNKNKEIKMQYVIVRSINSGVHAGYLVSREGDVVTLKDSRRLWRWVVAKMTGQLSSLSEVAVYGVNAKSDMSRIAVAVPEITILGVCEIIPASAAAQKSIEKA